MTIRATILNTLLIFLLGVISTLGEQFVQYETDGRGLSVQLQVPWKTLRVGERIQYEYILSNASDRAIPVAVPDDSFKEPHFGWPAGGQPFLEPIWHPDNPSYPFCPLPDGPLAVDKAQWPPIDGFGVGMRTWLGLPAGQRIVWNQNRLPAMYFGVTSGLSLEGIQAHWLVGPERWISSDVVTLKVKDVPRSEWKLLFEAHWTSYGLGTEAFNSAAYMIPIDGKLFLFFNDLRLTEIHLDDRMEHEIDEEGTNMEISITGPKGTRKVYHHLRHGLTRDTPWPIGPVELFFPKPEPIPAVELSTMRAEIGLNPDGIIPDGGLMPRPPGIEEGSNGLASDRESDIHGSEDTSGQSPAHQWTRVFIAVLILIAVSGLIFAFKHPIVTHGNGK